MIVPDRNQIQLSDVLKASTAELHRITEQTPLARLMISDQLTMASYEKYLSRLLQVHSNFEHAAFHRLGVIFPDLESRKKSTLIEADLHTSHNTKTAASARSLPFLAGYMYVLEGSALGGKLLLKNARTQLGTLAEGRMRFLNIYGENTGSMWKSFREQLNNYGARLSAEETEEVILGARTAFEDVTCVLQDELPA